MFTAKYSTTTPTNALRPSPGNVAISVDAGEDGPTSTTGWYNGFKIPEGGYLVIQSTSGNDPDYFPIANDTEMINLVKYTFGQSSISQVRDSLFYFLNNANTIVLDRIPNNVVTTDAFLNIDMSVLASYSSTERTILDLSGNQATGRVNNAPSYKPDPGVLDFDGTDENITYASPLCAGLDAWSWQSTVAFDVIQEGATSPYYQLYIEEAAIWIAQYANAVGIDMRQDSANVWFDGNGGTNTGAQIGLGNILPGMFNHFTWTLEQPDIIKGYFNGELEVVIPTGQNGPIRTGSPTTIGSRQSARYLDGQMRDTKTYASTLTEEQVRQNFFLGPIVTDGLDFSFDAANLVSYNPGDTTAFSLRPSNIKQNNISGALVNGVGWSKGGGGTWEFDGVDDRITLSSNINLGNGPLPWTVSAWVRTTTTVNALGQGPVASNDGSGPVYSVMGVNQGKIVYWTYQGGWVQFLGVKTVNDGEWHNLTWVNYSNSTMDMYVDGVLDRNVANSTSGNNNPIDAIGNSWAAIFDGDISSINFYQGKSLSSTEVIQNFEAQRNRFGL